MDKGELLAALASLSAEERQAILGTSTSGAPRRAKFSAALDQVPDEGIADVVNACRAGLKAIAAADPGTQAASDAEAAAVERLVKASPVVSTAAQTNSRDRGKPLAHSLSVAITYLQSAEAEAKRAAKRRAVPQPKAEKKPADQGAASGGGK
jgi:hypothetical protein